jgi:hypothetical protein
MSCTNCNCSDNTCGCKDLPLTTAPVYACPPDIKCPDPTPCYETIQDTCVKHGNYSIINFGALLAAGDSYPALPAGASLENAYQAMSVTLLDTACLPPINVHPTYIGTTTLTISWEDTGAGYYNFTIGTTPVGPFSPSSVYAGTSYTVTLLSPATTYYIKIESYCNSSADYSFGAIIAVTTLPVL